MIRIFRRIRQKLIADGSFRKYLLYAFGEIILIVAGVLLAVYLNNASTFRVKRIHEQKIIERIGKELESSHSRIVGFERLLHRKISDLEKLAPYFNGEPIEDKRAFLQGVVNAARFGWEQPTIEQTTFQEILSSGQLSLIRETELRLSITRFYHTVTQREARSNVRITDFPKIAYQLIPRDREASIEDELTDAEVDEITAQLLASDIRVYLTPEMNRAKFMLFIWEDMKEESIELREILLEGMRPVARQEFETPLPENPFTRRE